MGLDTFESKIMLDFGLNGELVDAPTTFGLQAAFEFRSSTPKVSN